MPSENKPAPSFKNRRGSPRKTPRSTAKVECRRGTLGLGPNLAVALLDFCENGARVILNAMVNPGEEIEVVIQDFGQSKAIKQVAHVCWCLAHPGDRYVVGLKFASSLSYATIQQVSRS